MELRNIIICYLKKTDKKGCDEVISGLAQDLKSSMLYEFVGYIEKIALIANIYD